MPTHTADVVVCGAGIAGVACAYFLTRGRGIDRVVIVDPRPPLTLTSDKSTECYRNWWPGPGDGMVALMSRSIDLLEAMADETDNAFGLGRRGYLFVTGSQLHLDRLRLDAGRISRLGAGDLRIHRRAGAYHPQPEARLNQVPDGADLLMGSAAVRDAFPWLTDDAVGALHVRRAGWLSAQQLGSFMLQEARDRGARLVRARVAGVECEQGSVVAARLDDGSRIRTRAFVNAAGPLLRDVGGMVEVDLPVHSEAHHKVALADTAGVFPRDAPLVIWDDPQQLDWSEEERRLLAAEGRDDLTGMLPPACHGRPEGGSDSPWVLALWEYSRRLTQPHWPIPEDPLYPETVTRGMSRMIPALSAYREHLPKTVVDGGYYTKTRENRPLVGPSGPRGSFVCGALSGFGVMAAPAVGELLSLFVAGESLPDHARWFRPDRYSDPDYLRLIDAQEDTGQL